MNSEDDPRLARAKKISAENYEGPVWVESGPVSDDIRSLDGEGHYHASVRDLIAACEEQGEPVPAYAWACSVERRNGRTTYMPDCTTVVLLNAMEVPL